MQKMRRNKLTKDIFMRTIHIRRMQTQNPLEKKKKKKKLIQTSLSYAKNKKKSFSKTHNYQDEKKKIRNAKCSTWSVTVSPRSQTLIFRSQKSAIEIYSIKSWLNLTNTADFF